MPARLTLPCSELRARYEAGQTTTMLARHYHCSPTTIASHLRACGATVRSSRFRPVQVSEEALRQLYLDERLSVAEIAEQLGVSVSTVYNKRRIYDIPRRVHQSSGAEPESPAGEPAGAGDQ